MLLRIKQCIAGMLCFMLIFGDISLYADMLLAPPSAIDEALLQKNLEEQVPDKSQMNRRKFLSNALGKSAAVIAGGIVGLSKQAHAIQTEMIHLSSTQDKNRTEVINAIEIVLLITDPDDSEEFKDKLRYILCATPAHESLDFRHDVQIKAKTAQSLWQIEPLTARDYIERVIPEMDRKESRKESPEKAVELVNYKIKNGDTLSAIAKAQLGKASLYMTIKRINNLTSDTIRAGQTIKIPKPGKPKTSNRFQTALAELAGLHDYNQLLTLCEKKGEEDLKALLRTNHAFSCFIARMIYRDRAEEKIRKLPGRKTIEKQFVKEKGYAPSKEEVEDIFAENCAEIWQEEYNKSTVDREGKKKLFVEHTKGSAKEYLVSNIPLLKAWVYGNYEVNANAVVTIDERTLGIGFGLSAIVLAWLGVVANSRIKAEKRKRKSKPEHIPRRRVLSLIFRSP